MKEGNMNATSLKRGVMIGEASWIFLGIGLSVLYYVDNG